MWPANTNTRSLFLSLALFSLSLLSLLHNHTSNADETHKREKRGHITCSPFRMTEAHPITRNHWCIHAYLWIDFVFFFSPRSPFSRLLRFRFFSSYYSAAIPAFFLLLLFSCECVLEGEASLAAQADLLYAMHFMVEVLEIIIYSCSISQAVPI